MKLLIAAAVASALLRVAQGAAPVAQPSTIPATAASRLPEGWAAGLDKPVAGITPIVLNLWEGKPPGFVENVPRETDDGTGRIRNVGVPGVLVYLPPPDKRPVGGMTCFVDCMAGSFDHLTRLSGASHHVETLCPKGIAIVSVKYRLKPISKNIDEDTLADGKRAMRLVRLHAGEWGIDPAKIGMLGASAGANIVLNVSTHFDLGDRDAADPVERQSCRPDFAVMISPWPNAHGISYYPVPAGQKMMPAFIGSAEDDRTAPYAFARAIEAQWKAAGAEVTFMSVSTGGHNAFSLEATGEGTKWPEKLLPWLEKVTAK
jgi:acetyl esterase/lipase